MENFLTSTEFYVIMLTLAALAVGLIVKPRDRGQAETTFATGVPGWDDDVRPRLEFECRDNGDVIVRRYGLSGLTSAATVALAITRIGFDLTIEERVTPRWAEVVTEANMATFVIEGLARERYHVKYNSESYSVFLTTGLVNRAGMRMVREFPT